MTAYAYIVECADGTLYSGWTNDLEKRIAAHNAGQGAKYTRSRRPVTLRYYEEFEDKSEALRRDRRNENAGQSDESAYTDHAVP